MERYQSSWQIELTSSEIEFDISRFSLAFEQETKLKNAKFLSLGTHLLLLNMINNIISLYDKYQRSKDLM